MSKELRAGIGFNDDSCQAVIVEVNGGEAVLRHLEEHQRTGIDHLWFLDIFRSFDRKLLSKISHLSLSMDHSTAFFVRFPLDATLNQVEQNEQVQWEMSQLLPAEEAKDLINDVHILRTNAREHLADALAIGYRRPIVFGIQKAFTDAKLNLQFLDVNLFAAEHALWYNHPELRAKTVCLLEVGARQSIAGILYSGRLISYHSSRTATAEEVVAFVDEFIDEVKVTSVVVYGTAVTFELMKSLRAAFGNHVAALNPFRRLHIDSNARNYERFIGLEHRFGASVGSAVRLR